MAESAKLSFELNEEMLALIAKEFDYHKLVEKFSNALAGKKANDIDKIAQDVFGSYGVDWIKRSMKLGEEYMDRTYELIREADDQTSGEMRFPLIPQRILEIAYLSVQDLELLPVLENNKWRLIYRLDNCKVNQEVVNKCGKDVAELLPCRHACLKACRTLFDSMGFPEVMINMQGATNKDGYCQFAIERP